MARSACRRLTWTFSSCWYPRFTYPSRARFPSDCNLGLPAVQGGKCKIFVNMIPNSCRSKGRAMCAGTPYCADGSASGVATTPERIWSGGADLNCRPHGPEPCALAWLSYTPTGLSHCMVTNGYQPVEPVDRLLAEGYTAREAKDAHPDALRARCVGAAGRWWRAVALSYAARLRGARPSSDLRCAHRWGELLLAYGTPSRRAVGAASYHPGRHVRAIQATQPA